MIKFSNGVRAFYAGGSKTTPGPKFTTEVIGTTGRLLITGNDQATLFRGAEAEPVTAEAWEVSGIEAGVQALVRAVVKLHCAELVLEDNLPGLRLLLRFPDAGPLPEKG